MIDNWNAMRAVRHLEEQLDPYSKNLVETELANLRYEIEALECEEDHIRGDYESDEDWVDVRALSEFLERKLSKLRIGVYNEQRDGNLLEVLEEIERILR